MADPAARRTARIAIGLALAALLVVLAVDLVPRLTRESHSTTSTPVPFGLRQPANIELGPGQTACMDGLVVDADSGRLLLWLDESTPLPTQPLRVTLSGNGYAVAARVAPQDRHELAIPIQAPSRDVVAELCVRNRGRAATTLQATADPRALVRTRATVDGGFPLAQAIVVTFTEREPSTPLSRLATTIERAATFNALGPWALWVLLPLLALGVPALVLGAFYVAARDDDGEPGADD